MSEAATVTRNSYLNNFPEIIPCNPQKFTYTGTAGTSLILAQNCSMVCIFPTTDCYINVTTAGTAATTSHIFCAGGVYRYIGIKMDAQYYISAIQSTAGGTLHIVEGF